MKNTPINEIYDLGDGSYCIREADSINCYLIIGENMALLFDTGYGYEDMHAIVRGITDLPLIVLNSHGDPDHSLGNCWFEEVHIHELDLGKLFRNDNSYIKRISIDYREDKLPRIKGYIDKENYLKTTVKDANYKFVRDGDFFNLGNKELEVIHIPGHSYGSIALLDKAKRSLYTGDMVTRHNIWYFGTNDEQASFNTAISSYTKLKQRSHEFDRIFPAHGPFPIDNSVLDDLLSAFDDLKLNHEADPLINTFVGDGYAHHYRNTLIIYSEERLLQYLSCNKCGEDEG
ncbi:MAG: MBL fold metallo-hydrolase [Bacillota bacterium]|nr:MBL fold metallo-hydrolase [Bacillota bacterium]HHU61193.1 MBL fold metallo-hydrolase [Natronincola sp.]